MITPKWMGFTPKLWATGNTRGTTSRTMVLVSISMPQIRNSTLTINRNISLLLQMDIMAVLTMAGIFRLVMTQPKKLALPMRNMMTELVTAEFFIAVTKRAHVNSR